MLTACGEAANRGVYKEISLGGVCWASSYSILSGQDGICVRRQMPLWTFGSPSTNRILGLIAALLSVSASFDVMVQIGAS